MICTKSMRMTWYPRSFSRASCAMSLRRCAPTWWPPSTWRTRRSPMTKSTACPASHTCWRMGRRRNRRRTGMTVSRPESECSEHSSSRTRATGANGRSRSDSRTTSPCRSADSQTARACSCGRQRAMTARTFSTGSTRTSGCRGTRGRAQCTRVASLTSPMCRFGGAAT
ncbi:MAG: hypothetical protein ABS61_08685 [Microbacterium sp. SCN 70-18]|nr:MAG: hypothetical protein ABS61_08685 [Microbacterium sp. SCN 70-18]